jgi:predicted ABC-type exoprotein transport system permease subunit
MASEQSGGRSLLATIVGWFLVAIIVLVLFHAVVGTVLWLFRTLVIVVVIVGLIALYLRLKSPPDSD